MAVIVCMSTPEFTAVCHIASLLPFPAKQVHSDCSLAVAQGVNVNAKAYNGDTARTLALTSGYMKIVSLIDNHVMPHSTLRSEPGKTA